MELSSEDALRLNVLLANKPDAIRIHESTMTLYALTDKGEMQVQLTPDCNDDRYLKRVREMLSGHVLGSPGGYPVYLQRWTRMGQMREDNLDQLLLLGEPEAVVAVSCAAGLTDELARRAWWAMDDADNARRMLANEAVRSGDMGPVLADYLVEHLPFESEPDVQMTTVAFVLQPGLISDEAKQDLWKRSRRKNSYLVGFLESCPNDLPGQGDASDLYRRFVEHFDNDDNAVVVQLKKLLSPQGQAFLHTAEAVLAKPSTQEIVTRSIDIIARYFAPLRPEGVEDLTLEQLTGELESYPDEQQSLFAKLTEFDDRTAGWLTSMRLLSGLGYGVLRPMLRDSTAIGSLMRRKVEPVLNPVKEHLKQLRVED
ncbi:sulfur reduction protein DsrS [Solemya velum gill symbiont]|uniref:sulfur reduction protein DsrS n=1 Tax=Solemya velum gill symbiont TaxID=2340 RepID=UPI00099755B2|nr:sulfur reduction protein DsrS [Solemya velum gill symbiont]OOZ80000.1 sulfur reduction protein DsrS [Solemya velum gill symbiont]